MEQAPHNEYRDQRLDNLNALEALGRKPYGGAFARTARLAELQDAFEEGREVTAAGRLMTIRRMGKTIFADLNDGSGRFQIFINQGVLGDDGFDAFRLLDLGDTIGVSGALFVTRTGEPSIRVTDWSMLSKALLPLPEKWHGLKDLEQRYRQRYLDLIANQAVRERFDKRSRTIHEIRLFLVDRGFREVETPMMQPLAGGAAAKPFQTHYAALHTDMFLRIAPELYLKRLLVGGFDKVFELNRNFRNEGLDRTHNPEFTMLELYEAYSDVNGMKQLVQEMIVHVAQAVFGSLETTIAGETISLAPPWRSVTYHELVRAAAGDDWFSLETDGARERARERGLDIPPDWDHLLITHEIYEKLVEKSLRQPTFVHRFPAPLIPLAKACADDATLADVFELVIAGQEVAPAYSELNDPQAQRQRLLAQAGNEQERLDEDFLTALEYGMPPAGGMGLGIDRLIMILTGCDAIRDVILFPQLRPHKE